MLSEKVVKKIGHALEKNIYLKGYKSVNDFCCRCPRAPRRTTLKRLIAGCNGVHLNTLYTTCKMLNIKISKLFESIGM